jgi:hypothetical protein
VLLRAAAVGLSLLAYGPIVGNYFHADDFVNFYWLVTEGPLAYAMHPHGGHVLVARNTVTWALHAVCGTRASCYFAFVLVTHLASVWLLFDLVRDVTRSARLACLAAALWGTAPLAEGSLGWYSVFGHVLATTCLLVVLRDVVACAGTGDEIGWRRTAAWAGVLVVGSTCFGVGVAAALVFPAVALLLVGRVPPTRGALLVLASLPFVVLGTYTACNLIYTRVFGGSPEVVLTLLGLLTSWTTIARMLVHLVAVAASGVTAGAVAYPSAAAVAIALALGAGVVVVLVRGDGDTRRRVLAFGLLAVATYGIIAAGRANVFLALSQPQAPSEAATNARYHYMGLVPVTVLLALVLARLGAAVALPARMRNAALAAVLLALGVRAVVTARTLDDHAADRAATAQVLDSIRVMIALHQPGEAVHIPNRAFAPVRFFERSDVRGFPGWAAAFVVFFPDNVVNGRRVYFMVDEAVAQAASTSGLRRVDSLLVPPRA